MFQIDLVERCKANNRKAQMALYKQYCSGMFCVAMRFLNNEGDAEDVLQESFLKAFQKIDQFKGEVTFGAWLKRIVINTCLDFRKAKNEQLVTLDENYMLLEEDDNWKVSDDINIGTVKNAIGELPEKYSNVVQLFLVEGYDHSEISQILDIKETTCRTRLLRGKGYLKKLLNREKYGARS